MRQNCEIVVAVQDQAPVTDQEIRLALLCYAHAASAAARLFHDLVEKADDPHKLKFAVRLAAKGQADAYWRMIKQMPDKYLGPRYTPGTPEFAEAQAWARKVFKNATGQDIDDLGLEVPR